MAEITEADYAEAVRRGTLEMAVRPRARSARYDRQQDRVVVDLFSGATFSFPPRLLQGLENATADQLTAVEVPGAGFGLHWDELDIDFTVAGLLAGRFGTARYMVERFGSEWDVQAAE